MDIVKQRAGQEPWHERKTLSFEDNKPAPARSRRPPPPPPPPPPGQASRGIQRSPQSSSEPVINSILSPSSSDKAGMQVKGEPMTTKSQSSEEDSSDDDFDEDSDGSACMPVSDEENSPRAHVYRRPRDVYHSRAIDEHRVRWDSLGYLPKSKKADLRDIDDLTFERFGYRFNPNPVTSADFSLYTPSLSQGLHSLNIGNAESSRYEQRGLSSTSGNQTTREVPSNYDAEGPRSANSVPLSTDAEQQTRVTPTSLGWSPDSYLVNLYKLVMVWNVDPYLELLNEANVSKDTPLKVFLDKSEDGKDYSCPWPVYCRRQDEPFTRRADLERHLKNIHGPEEMKRPFRCPYDPCINGRHLPGNAFSRKDHMRDHLRDFHQEDIGAARRERLARTDEERRRWEKEQRRWLASRKISSRWWTCARCLERRYVERDGWNCATCDRACESEREERRLRISNRKGSITGEQVAQASTSTTVFKPREEACISCHGKEWVDRGYGGLALCPTCKLIPHVGSTSFWVKSERAEDNMEHYGGPTRDKF
ncbi:hypothetical protein ONS95_006910 [Cadophora gregata]|uniref:uncharacterized protein n=1 Tax=Cadophora gregata TaxID=51156 RepID=UPI0026DD4484|nr:uncharacterized protein ONS95_006910 [Cadophora gregata]KAK0101757.1 hypothetical protein ONS95_006910 [Cadophora gregata]